MVEWTQVGSRLRFDGPPCPIILQGHTSVERMRTDPVKQQRVVQQERYISYKNVGCRWPGSFNFSSERPHVCQYLCAIIRSRVP